MTCLFHVNGLHDKQLESKSYHSHVFCFFFTQTPISQVLKIIKNAILFYSWALEY